MMRVSRARHLLEQIFGLDLRSLALLRIGLGLLLLLDIADRLPGVAAHYSDGGVLPRDALREFEQGWIPSLHSLSGEAAFQAALMAALLPSSPCLSHSASAPGCPPSPPGSFSFPSTPATRCSFTAAMSF